MSPPPSGFDIRRSPCSDPGTGPTWSSTWTDGMDVEPLAYLHTCHTLHLPLAFFLAVAFAHTAAHTHLLFGMITTLTLQRSPFFLRILSMFLPFPIHRLSYLLRMAWKRKAGKEVITYISRCSGLPSSIAMIAGRSLSST